MMSYLQGQTLRGCCLIIARRLLHTPAMCCNTTQIFPTISTRKLTTSTKILTVPRRCSKLQSYRLMSSTVMKTDECFTTPEPEFDWKYLCDETNTQHIQENILNRKGVGDIQELRKLWKSYNEAAQAELPDKEHVHQLRTELLQAAADIPNRTHPRVAIGDESQNVSVELVGQKREFDFTPCSIVQLGEHLKALRLDNVGIPVGPGSYYFIGALAQLQQALIKYTVDQLIHNEFNLISVPDLVHPAIVEGCGFKTSGERTQVYKLDPNKHGHVCLAGTGEMPLAGFLMNRRYSLRDLPKKFATVSRCYRAEASPSEDERGIYRVHQFYKVEMFVIAADETGEESEAMLAELISIQRRLFADLGLTFRVLDMSSQELGAPAFRKYDMEAWMPARQFWGEISSASNCIDFQSRRLNIKYHSERHEGLHHVHTMNGTACALPRLIMAIVENNQNRDGSVEVPAVLQPYMGGQTTLKPPSDAPEMKWIRLTKGYKKQTKAAKS